MSFITVATDNKHVDQYELCTLHCHRVVEKQGAVLIVVSGGSD